MITESDTPRTDAAASDGWSDDQICVDANFARELERELIAMQKERDALRAQLLNQ